jgi:hypothetical protein
LFDVIDVSEWEVVQVVATGRRPKEWLIEPEARRHMLFKSVVHHPAEVAAERVASEIGTLLAIPTAQTALAMKEGTQGILSFRVTTGSEALVDGGDLLMVVEPAFQRAAARVHGFQLVRAALPPELLPPFIDLLLLDAVIGNSDRHQDNWSIVQSPPNLIRLAPSYDHGSSLGRDISEETLEARMADEDLNRYVANGRSRVGWREGAKTRHLRHLDLLQHVAVDHPDLVEASLARLSGITRHDTDAIVDELPDAFASRTRRALMKEILWRRIALIRTAFNVPA